MIRRILVALDPDSDTTVATKYAVEMAKQTGARITGLAVVDTGSIEASSRGGGIGSFYYAEKLRDQLTQETREQAQSLITAFEKVAEQAGVEHMEVVEEGVPFERIVEDMKVHDLLIIGNDPHFFYGHPKTHTHTLERVFHKTIGPTLVVSDTFRPVRKVLVATDGENAASRALRRFIQVLPFGSDIELVVMYIIDKDRDQADASLHLELIKSYLSDHGLKARCLSMTDSDPAASILMQAESNEADLILVGVHTQDTMRGITIGKNTKSLLEKSKVPLFLDH